MKKVVGRKKKKKTNKNEERVGRKKKKKMNKNEERVGMSTMAHFIDLGR